MGSLYAYLRDLPVIVFPFDEDEIIPFGGYTELRQRILRVHGTEKKDGEANSSYS